MKKFALASLAALACIVSTHAAQAQACNSTPLTFFNYITEVEGDMTVKAGKGCAFSLNGIDGAINEVKVSQKPKAGIAGVEGGSAYYIAKAGYQGPDEVAFTFIGIDQYGGPMRVTVKRRITVVP